MESEMNPELEGAILIACIKAIEALGDGYKGMSCFLYQWGAASPEVISEQKKAA